ncbi:unnamed protein product [Fusarium equiseti]|uniref:Uncharacterized protein n=1 Tax=Fusarium equiseti TaxID=61235 RepID=A0A8J2IIN6_FUSEQ|nr:unnamed protein product [Fusarium equiseti]
MALMLAPYNEAMRLGMGFNSYTQQLCCNDIVRSPGGRPATESDLKDTKQNPPGTKAVASSGAEAGILSTQQGTGTIMQKRIGVGYDEQNVVSQVVNWNASFVDSVSEVTKKLDISGALSVNVDAIGSVKVSGHYVDDKALKESDATYDITVNVTNQRLEAPEMTQFTPIANVEADRFQEVYGDCFISGFLEGGVFHAVVACKKVDDKATLDAGGQISAGAQIAGLDIKGEIKANFNTGSEKKNYTTTVTVNWSGGGDIKPNKVEEWTIEHLTRVAMDFPDKVAACPQRTYAVLTKYTSLRSFHEATSLGSPLDYENAGIYTNSLLDAYMDYKYIWSQIQERISAVDKGLMKIQKLEEQDGLASYRDAFVQSYQERMEAFHKAEKDAKENPRRYRDIVLQPPMPPNGLRAYSADLYGLDHAKRDCRFEMIKIVREVKAVSLDPQIATDPTRIWQYVAPSIFRRLVPADKPIDKKDPRTKAAIQQDLSRRIEGVAQDYQEESMLRESFFQSGPLRCDYEKRVNLRYGHLAEHWRVDTINGQSVTLPSFEQFNDLEVLDKSYIVTNITVWHDNKRLVGIQLLYQNGQALFHGVKDSSYQLSSFNIESGRKGNPDSVNMIWLEAHADENGKAWVDTLRVVTTSDLLIVEPADRLKYNTSFELKATKPKSNGVWDLKGFYGSFDPSEKAFAQLSPIWGRTAVDDPAPKAIPLFLPAAWKPVLSWPILTIESLSRHVHRGNNFRFSCPRGKLDNCTGAHFNALDYIDESWVIGKVEFCFTDAGDTSVLAGIAVEYKNGKQLQHGNCGPKMFVQTWEPSGKENERLVAVSTCVKGELGQPQCCLGLRFFFETEEEMEDEEKENVVNSQGSEAAQKTTATSAESKPIAESAASSEPTATSEGPEPVATSKPAAARSDESKAVAAATPAPAPAPAPVDPPKKKMIKETDLWVSGPKGDRENFMWQLKAASHSPSGQTSEKWAVKGFMGQAGMDCIETISVVWGRE